MKRIAASRGRQNGGRRSPEVAELLLIVVRAFWTSLERVSKGEEAKERNGSPFEPFLRRHTVLCLVHCLQSNRRHHGVPLPKLRPPTSRQIHSVLSLASAFRFFLPVFLTCVSTGTDDARAAFCSSTCAENRVSLRLRRLPSVEAPLLSRCSSAHTKLSQLLTTRSPASDTSQKPRLCPTPRRKSTRSSASAYSWFLKRACLGLLLHRRRRSSWAMWM